MPQQVEGSGSNQRAVKSHKLSRFIVFLICFVEALCNFQWRPLGLLATFGEFLNKLPWTPVRLLHVGRCGCTIDFSGRQVYLHRGCPGTQAIDRHGSDFPSELTGDCHHWPLRPLGKSKMVSTPKLFPLYRYGLGNIRYIWLT